MPRFSDRHQQRRRAGGGQGPVAIRRGVHPRAPTTTASTERAVGSPCRLPEYDDSGLRRSAPDTSAVGQGSAATTLPACPSSGTASTSPYPKRWEGGTRAAHACCSRRASTTTARSGSTASATGSGAPSRGSTVPQRSGGGQQPQPGRPVSPSPSLAANGPPGRSGRRRLRPLHQPQLRVARRRPVGRL